MEASIPSLSNTTRTGSRKLKCPETRTSVVFPLDTAPGYTVSICGYPRCAYAGTAARISATASIVLRMLHLMGQDQISPVRRDTVAAVRTHRERPTLRLN